MSNVLWIPSVSAIGATSPLIHVSTSMSSFSSGPTSSFQKSLFDLRCSLSEFRPRVQQPVGGSGFCVECDYALRVTEVSVVINVVSRHFIVVKNPTGCVVGFIEDGVQSII